MEDGIIRDEEMEGLEEEKKKIENYLLEDNYFSTFSSPMRVNDMYPGHIEEVNGALAGTEASDILDEMDSFEANEIEGRLSIDEAAMDDIEDSLLEVMDDVIREKVRAPNREPLSDTVGVPRDNNSHQFSENYKEICEDLKYEVKENFEVEREENTGDQEKTNRTNLPLKLESEPSSGDSNAPILAERLDSELVHCTHPKAAEPKDTTSEGGDPEEGELEEGELEEEESQEQASLAKETKVVSEKEIKEEIKEKTKPEKVKTDQKESEKNNKTENAEKKEKSEHKKRKHKDKEEESEKSLPKKRKHHFTPEEESEGGVRKKVPTVREKSLDFDTLLKRQMYLVGSGPIPETMFPPEDKFEHNQFRGECDSFESGSGDEWSDGVKQMRRRVPRKRRGGSRSPSRKNEAICMFYLQGSCKRGGDCPYSHDIAPTRKMELCKFYMMDCCAKREKCLYMHKDFPCKYYHFGIKCKDGDLCKFSHDPLQDIVKNILIKHIELAPKDILGDFPRLTKRSAQIILIITEAKRNGEPIDTELLEKVSEHEGKGFRYLDRAIKNLRKKRDGERSNKIVGEKEKEEEPPKVREKDEKEEERERPKEASKSKERDHKDREKSPKKSKSYDKEGQRERTKEKKERGKDRDNRRRDREKGGSVDEKGGHSRGDKWQRDRHRSDGVRGGSSKGDTAFDSPFKLKDSFAEMTPKQKELSLRLEDRRMQQDYNNRGPLGRNSSLAGPNYPIEEDPYPPSDDPYPMQDTRWYSSDEDVDPSRSPPDGRRDSFASPHGGRRQRPPGGDAWGLGNQALPQGGRGHPQSEGHPPTNFLDQSNLSNIDFSYLKNVLNTVQSQTSQNKNLKQNASEVPGSPGNWGGGDERRHSSSSGYPSRDRSVNNYMDIANDIKEVFYDPPEPSEPRNFSRNLDSFIHSAREMSTSNGPEERSFSKQESRASPMLRSNRDSQDSLNDGSPWKRRDITDPRLKGGMSSKEDSLSSDSNAPFGMTPKNPAECQEGDISPNREKAEMLKKDLDIKSRSSIYDLGYGSQDSIQSPDYDDGSDNLPFKVPDHSSAKEIDGSINTHSPVEYRLVRVTIPKPDFSKLKINKNDPKTLEDPRLKMMLRRPSNEESSRSPRGAAPVVNNVEPSSFGSPLIDPKVKLSTKIAEIESRDPRKASVRDPRADPRVDPRTDPRGDPRTDSLWLDGKSDSRSDPRLDNRNTPSDPRSAPLDPRADAWADPRMDPRMAQRGPGCRMDPRDSLLGPDLLDSDPRVGGAVFNNGLMDGAGFGSFGGISNHSPILPRNIDPRGRPGLLGPGPSPNSMAMGQIGQSLNPSPFLLQTPIGHQAGPFMSRDRGEMMGGPGPNYPQGQGWGGGRSHFNDPRLGSNGDFSSPMS